MALFNKLFNKRKLVKPPTTQTTSPFPFNKEQVRVLLFRECDWRGRRLLFDSSAIEKSSNCKSQFEHTSFDQFDDNSSYKCGKPNNDWKEIREMAFGSIAVSFCGTSFKVHWLNDPTRLLCSQVFLAPIQYSNSNTSSYSTASSSSRFSTFLAPDVVISDVNNSVSDTMSLSSSMSISENVDLPLSLDNNELRFVSQMSNEESSGYSSEPWHSRPISSTRSSLASIFSDVGSQGGRKMSFESSSDFITDYGRFNRRILKNLSTSFENVSSVDENPSISTSNFSDSNNTYYTVTGATNNVNGLSDGCILKLRRNSDIFVRRKTTSGDALSSNTSPSHNRSKRPRLAIAVSITLNDCSEQDLFCSEHMVLLESMLHRVKFAAEQAYVHRQKNLFNLVMIKAWLSISQWMIDFFSYPRLTCPLWVSLSSDIGPQRLPIVTVNSFVNDLISLLNTSDTKNTNFFMTTLITAILTYHLGWVPTVTPLIASNIRETKEINSKFLYSKRLQNEENMKLSEISKCYPYNVLWAQLSDLLGAVTNPVKICRTIICGSETNDKTIEKILNVLTYFIRCSEIRRNQHYKIFDKDQINKIVNQQLNYKKPLSESITEEKKGMRKSNGLARSTSTVKNLSLLSDEDKSDDQKLNESDFPTIEDREKYMLLHKTLKKNVMNDVPKVLAFRDSRFVKQELRIGNKSMDTGIEMNAKDKAFLSKYINKLEENEEVIKLTISSHDCDDVIEITDQSHMSRLSNFNTAKNHNSIKIFDTRIIEEEEENLDHVEFFLGENERLVGLKNDTNLCQKTNITKIENNNNSSSKCDSCVDQNKLIKFLKVPSFTPNIWEFNEFNENSPCDVLNIIDIPLLETAQSHSIQDDILKPGFTSSLFSSTCDHYISDMILQGVTTQLNGFENQLKRDLMIAAQSGILDQTYSENIAIVANIDKFDVRIISSNSSSIQSSNNSSGIGIVGMSNLVGVMLETVHSLALSGASEFQCLSYIESKLKEIYHLSEALASLLLETEFCTLNILSTSLNLSINDIPLLISIASVHTPSISKRYGISFR